MDEQIDDVRERVAASGWDACVVVNDERVVFGLLRADQLAEGSDGPVADVMLAGPTTFRPHVSIEELAHYMLHHDITSSPITTSEGRLVGLLTVEDAARSAHEHHEHEDGEDS